jgi:hypothetical protein
MDDSSAELRHQYYYKVSTYTNLGEGELSLPDGGHRLSPPPAPYVQGTYYHISVSWQSVSGAGAYGVYRSANSVTGPYSRIDSVTRTTYYDTVGYGQFYYKISSYAASESGLSEASNGAKRLYPATPSSITATRGTMVDTILVQWTASQGAEGYMLYRDIDTGFSNPVLISTDSATFYYDTVGDDQIYAYRVKAFNGAGESVLTRLALGYRMPSVVPGPPVNPGATDTLPLDIRIWWSSPVTGGITSGYVVTRSETETGTYSEIARTNSLYYYDRPPLTYPTYYWYKIHAYNIVGDGSPSAAVSGARR